MSTGSVSSTTSTTGQTGYQLGSLPGSSPIQITGLASGLNTNQIIQEEMSLYQQPVTNLQNQSKGLTAQNSALTSIQSELTTLETEAQALGDPSLFSDAQTTTSTDPSLVSATTTAGSEAVVGGYQIGVTALASSAQRTYTFTSPASADTITIDGQTVSLNANATAQDFANAVNSNGNLDVWAAVSNSGTVVLSDRATGAQTGTYISVTDPGGALTEQTGLANAGQNASFTVNGTTMSSSSNSPTNAIPGLTLNLSGVTPAGSPVTINVGAPAPSTSNIQTALNTFITQYNKVIGDIQTQLSTPPLSSDPTVGTLYQDPELSDLLSSMRSMMIQNQNGSSSIQNMLAIGVSTGATTGSGAVSQSALNGVLQLNSSTLDSAVQSNPAGVQQMLVGFAANFSTLVGATADPGGTIDNRVQGDDVQITALGNQISAMQAALSDKQSALVAQFAQLEAALSSNQSQASWLTSQIASLPGA
ncbi:MAG TPA: flagellar filament capping protein FliD [Solirubrobacteraceae bacterium]|nr:flagellar filament capping protein FliD [Solirubrobacteraceae bacterium]